MIDIPTNGGQSPMIGGGPSAKEILDSPNISCECGNKIFTEAFVIKKVSGILTGNVTDTLCPIPVYICSKCGKIPKEFLEKANANKILGETETTE